MAVARTVRPPACGASAWPPLPPTWSSVGRSATRPAPSASWSAATACPCCARPKILPDLAEGHADTPSALATPAPFEVARLPFGQVAVLVGEDATAAHLVRAAMWRGAEIVLNPAREFTDDQFALRQQARMARAYENHLCLATASPSTLTRAGGFVERLPPASALYDEWALPVRAGGGESFLRVSLDVEAVRRRRAEYFGNLCVSTRPTVYAPGYRAAIAARPAAAPATAPTRRAGLAAEGERRAARVRGGAPGARRCHRALRHPARPGDAAPRRRRRLRRRR